MSANASGRDLKEELQALSAELAVAARENARQARALKRALEERDRLYWHLRRVQELLPICMDCDAVRPEGEWMGLAEYLRRNEIAMSHGLCPTCADRRMGDIEPTA